MNGSVADEPDTRWVEPDESFTYAITKDRTGRWARWDDVEDLLYVLQDQRQEAERKVDTAYDDPQMVRDDLESEVQRLREALERAERFLGQALTCAMHGLNEMDWLAVERFLRRDEAAAALDREVDDD
jgi:hypothetical protein